MALLDEDLNGDGILEMGETAPPPVMQTTSAPTPTPTPTPTPPVPGTPTPPAASNTPPWLAQFRAGQDKRIADWRGGTDAFFGGLDKVFQGDLKGGFGQWHDYGDAQRAARRTAMDERMAKLGERFKMPEGFAGKLPWGQSLGHRGKSGASGLGGSTQGAGGTDPSMDTPKEAKPAQHSAWWAGGWGGGKNRQGRGMGKKPAPKPTTPATPAAPATPTPEDDEEV